MIYPYIGKLCYQLLEKSSIIFNTTHVAIKLQLEMWVSAQHDRHPTEYRWHPPFNDEKFG